MSKETDERDLHEEHQDRELLEEAGKHPERFARYPQTRGTERPTPITDALVVRLQKSGYNPERGGDFEILSHARDLERQLAEARENLEITQREWVAAKAERAEALRERGNVSEQLAEAESEMAKHHGTGRGTLAERITDLAETAENWKTAAMELKNQLAAERALADRLVGALKATAAYPVTGNWWGDAQDTLAAWKEARK